VPMAYSRNFYDTDQRPLRRILQNTDQPFLIIHGEHDPLVPVEAAREHKRIVPQSEYHELATDHFFIFQTPGKVVQLLDKFWNDVEHEKAKTRQNADPDRINEANKPFKFQILKATGATLFVFFLLLAVITFINEDLAFLLAGIFIAQGRFGFSFAIITCLNGIIISLIFWLLLGRFRGQKILIFDRFGSKNIFTNRNFGFRFPIYFGLGKPRKEFWKYLAKLILSAVIWMLLLVFASYILASALISGVQNTFGLILYSIIIYSLISLIIRKLV
jgi:membrane protein DedA with SNARE-associated domain